MNSKFFVVVIILFLGGSGFLQAQEDPQFTQFMANRLFFNPAYAGVDQETQISLSHRTQWAAYQPSFDDGGAPNTTVLAFSTAFPKFNSGIGFYASRDRLGPLTNVDLELSYAYHVKLSENSTLSLGGRGGLFFKRFDFDQYRFAENGDPFDLEGTETVMVPDVALGVYLKAKNLFLGITANHVSGAEFDLGRAELNREALANSYYLMGGYDFDLGGRRSFILTPTFFAKTSEFNEFSFDVGALLTYNERFWFGGTFRNEESGNVIIGVNVPRRISRRVTHDIRIGYSFDYVYAGQDAKEPTSHELSIIYALPVKQPLQPAIIRTPRFRKKY